jgi:hypothetical protein
MRRPSRARAVVRVIGRALSKILRTFFVIFAAFASPIPPPPPPPPETTEQRSEDGDGQSLEEN